MANDEPDNRKAIQICKKEVITKVYEDRIEEEVRINTFTVRKKNNFNLVVESN